jgi:hypothetical protein
LFDLLVSVMASVGLTLIITESFILESLRGYILKASEKAGYLVACPMCMGVWIGGLVATAYNLDVFMLAMLTSLCSFMLMSIINTMNYLSDFLFSKTEEVDSLDEQA